MRFLRTRAQLPHTAPHGAAAQAEHLRHPAVLDLDAPCDHAAPSLDDRGQVRAAVPLHPPTVHGRYKPNAVTCLWLSCYRAGRASCSLQSRLVCLIGQHPDVLPERLASLGLTVEPDPAGRKRQVERPVQHVNRLLPDTYAPGVEPELARSRSPWMSTPRWPRSWPSPPPPPSPPTSLGRPGQRKWNEPNLPSRVSNVPYSDEMITDADPGTSPTRQSAWSPAEDRGFEPRRAARPNRISSAAP